MTRMTQEPPSRGLYERLLAAERIGAELAYELEIRAPEFMLRKALGGRGSTVQAIIADWVQLQTDLPGVVNYPLEDGTKEELGRRLKAQLVRSFPDRCNY